jgi:hypothetical protein
VKLRSVVTIGGLASPSGRQHAVQFGYTAQRLVAGIWAPAQMRTFITGQDPASSANRRRPLGAGAHAGHGQHGVLYGGHRR